MLGIDTNQERPQRQEVSNRALAIARQIDRLGSGTYTIRLEKFESAGDQWNVKIEGVVEVREFRAYEPRPISEAGKELKP